jgi:hypothetical protein
MVGLPKIRRQWRVRGAAILAVAISSLSLVSVANGQMPTSVSVQAERAGSGRMAEAIYELHIGAGEEGAAFGFEYELPSWPGSTKVVGSPIVVTSVVMAGAGSMRPATPPPVLKPRLKRADVCLRTRSAQFGNAYWVEVPANGTAVIEVKGRGAYPSWPGTQYMLSFALFETDSPSALRSPLQSVATPGLGVKGVHILMQVRHSAARREENMSPEIVGQTQPVLKSAHIQLRAVRPALSGSVTISQWTSPSKAVLGTVRTNGQGRFRLSPKKFPFVGEYAILAKSQAREGLAADWNCGPRFLSP